jgi:hypothetical protein
MSVLHTYSDGSTLRRITARELIRVPVWKGNRIMDVEHAESIKRAIGANIASLDNGYRIVKYYEQDATGRPLLQSYIIDGQHRTHVLRDFYDTSLCEPDFDLTVTEKHVASESEAIAYFNALNNVKPQCWKTDKNLLANQYIAELEARFNVRKRCPFIRPANTHRPYLSSERLREALLLNADVLTDTGAKTFAARAVDMNKELVENCKLALAINPDLKDASIVEKAIECGFMLGVENPAKWIPKVA